MLGGVRGLAVPIRPYATRKVTGYRAPQLNRRKRRPRNEAVARRVKARSEDGPKSARHRGDELGGWAGRKGQGEGEFSRSGERRGGEESRTQWSPYDLKTKLD